MRVVNVLKYKLGSLCRTSNTRLINYNEDIKMAVLYKVDTNGRLALSGFSSFAAAYELEVGSVILVTIKKCTIVNVRSLIFVINVLP